MNLTKEFLSEEYHLFKDRAKAAFRTNKTDRSLNLAMYCAYIAWAYPILYNFIDEDLENLLEMLSDRIITPDSNFKSSKKNNVALYCGQLIDNGGLTEQYLHYFLEKKYNILVIVPTIKNIGLAKRTICLIESSPEVEFYVPPSRRLSDKIREIYYKVLQFRPQNIFLHFMPHDVVGYCAFFKLNHFKRFYIVHNDHTFWLGKGCSDFFLEFRKFGYLISTERRGIADEKVLLLPFYPINNMIKFRGFPFNREGKIVGISGANVYKYFLEPRLEYFYAIKQLLKTNKDFVFCLCGYGEGIEKIQAIFDDKSVCDRFFSLGRRDDFYALVGNSDILFDSYPFKGGLTNLIAIEQDIAVVGIGNSRNASGCIQDNFDLNGYKEPMNFEKFIDEANSLIKFNESRHWKVSLLKNQKFNKDDFTRRLSEILDQVLLEKPKLNKELLSLDDDYYLKEYLQIPNSRSSFLKSKLFLLRDSLGLKERVLCYFQLIKSARHLFRKKELYRLAFLVVSGK